MFSTVGGGGGGSVPSTMGEYHDARTGYLEYRVGCSVLWGDIMINVFGIS